MMKMVFMNLLIIDTKLQTNSSRKNMRKANIRLLHGDVREYKRCLEATKKSI